ncbi:MAG: hypothetical protein AB1765_05480, partial [Candidatus Hydrogenedentota bacterium]
YITGKDHDSEIMYNLSRDPDENIEISDTRLSVRFKSKIDTIKKTLPVHPNFKKQTHSEELIKALKGLGYL